MDCRPRRRERVACAAIKQRTRAKGSRQQRDGGEDYGEDEDEDYGEDEDEDYEDEDGEDEDYEDVEDPEDPKWKEEIEEVVVTAPGSEDPEEDPEDEYPEEDDDPWGDEEDPEDEDIDWENEIEEVVVTAPEQECTCEMSKPRPLGLQSGWAGDADNLLSQFGKYTVKAMKRLIDLKPTIPFVFITEEEYDAKIAAYSKMIGIIDEIDNSNHSFRIERGDVDEDLPIVGGVSKDENGQYVMTIYTKDPNAYGSADEHAVIAHELMHVYQMLNGEFGFDDDGLPTMLDIDNEIAAYQMQAYYEQVHETHPAETITKEKVIEKDSGYENLPDVGGSCPVHGG